MGCDCSTIAAAGLGGCGFQYPRTDRMGCDSFHVTAHYDADRTFSILERIEWAAT